MTNKFTAMKERFAEMYQKGRTYREICTELDISVLTAHEWRKKLRLAPRIERRPSPVSWMDERNIQGRSPRQILETVAKPLGLSARDIEFILIRFEKLRSKGLHRGKLQIHLILTAAYLYVRWEASHRQPISPKNFLRICSDSKFRLNRRTLLMHCRLFQEAGLYPATHLKPQELLERMWNSLKSEFHLSEQVKSDAMQFMSELKFTGRSPEVVVAACLYAAALRCRIRDRTLGVVTQKQLADTLGITEVSVRNAWNLINSSFSIRDRSTYRFIESGENANESEDTESFLESPNRLDDIKGTVADSHLAQTPLEDWTSGNKGTLLVSEVEAHIGGSCANCSKCMTHNREATHLVLFSPDHSESDSVLVSAVCGEGKQYHASSPNVHNVKGFLPITRELFTAIKSEFPKTEVGFVSSDDPRRKQVSQFVLSSQERMSRGENVE
jgi:transcription initiation factor TFIIIB Brf1 subunit/transcription initiation factor TFIIB